MNNKPITARVKSGMFKTKEPLLNVGPAGVDGNNKTRTMPSPSKMKGYSMKSSPFKQAKTTKDVVTEAIEDQITDKGISLGTTTTTVTPSTEGTAGKDAVPGKVTGQMPGGKMSDAEWKNYLANEPAEKKAARHEREEDAGVREKGTDAVAGTPGTDDKEVKKKTAIIEKVARKGEASDAYGTRNNLRKAKVAARNAKKYQRKQDKADRRKDPTLDAKEQRRARKETASQSIKKVADSEVRNAQIQSKQGKTGFSGDKSTVLDDVNRQQGEKTDTRQRELGTEVKTPAEMKNTGFFKKKSPMKMNYFKK